MNDFWKQQSGLGQPFTLLVPTSAPKMDCCGSLAIFATRQT
jgi:hypothetical protein